MSLWILLTAPLVWLVLTANYSGKEKRKSVVAGGAFILTALIYLALYGLVKGFGG